jgi:TP901 family phage tail tape measure protein
MAAKRQQLDLAVLDQLIEKLDKVYNRLVEAEDKLDKFNKKSISIKIDKKTLDSLDQLTDRLDRIGRSGAGGVSFLVGLYPKLEEAITGIANAFNAFKTVKVGKRDLDNLENTLTQVRRILAEAGKTANISGSALAGADQLALILSRYIHAILIFKTSDLKNINSTDINQFLHTVETLATGIKNAGAASKGVGDLAQIDELGRVFLRFGAGLSTAFRTLKNIDSTGIQVFINTFALLSTGVKKAAADLAGQKGLSELDELAKVFLRFGAGLRGVEQSLRFVKKDEINTIVEIFTLLSTALKKAAAEVGEIAGLGQLDSIARILLRLGAGLKTLDDSIRFIDKSTVSHITETFNSLVSTLIKIARDLADVGDLGQFETISKAISRLGVGLKTIEDGIRFFDEKTVGKIASVFTQLTVTLRQAADLQALLPGLGQLDALSKIFNALGNGFTSLEQASRFISARTAVKLNLIFGALAVSFKLLASFISLIPGLAQLQSLSTAFQKLGTGFVNLETASRFIAAGTVIKLTLIFAALSISFKSLAHVLQIIPGEDALTSLATVFQKLGSGFKSLQETSEKISLGTIVKIGLIFAALVTTFKSISFILTAIPGGNALNDLGGVFTQIANAFTALQRVAATVSIGQVAKLGLIFGAIGGAVKTLGSVNNISRIDENVLPSIAQVFSAIGKTMKSVSDATKNVGFFQISKLKKVLTTITEVITETAKAAAQTVGVDGLESMGTAFARFGKGIQALVTVAKTLPAINPVATLRLFLQVRQLGNVIKQVAKSLGEASASVAKIGNLEALGALSEAFARLGKALPAMNRVAQTTDKKTIKSLKSFISGLTDALKSLNKLKDPSSLASFGGVIESLHKLLEKVSTLPVSGKLSKQFAFTGPFTKFVKDMTGVIKALVPIVGKNIPDIAGLITSLADIAKLDLTATPKNFDWIPAVSERVAKGLKNLADVKIDPEKVDALAKAAEALEKMSKLSGATEGPVKAFGKVADGMTDVAREKGRTFGDVFKEQFARRMADAVISVAQELNPIKLFKGFVYGVINFGKAVFNTLTSIRNKARELADSIKQIGQEISSFGQNLIGRFGVSQLINSAAFQSAVGFDSLSTQLQTFGRLTDDQLKKAQDFANEIGIQYPLSANEALDAILQLSKAGQDLPSIEKILPSAADIAALSDSKDINNATQILIGAQAAFSEFADGIPGTFDNIAIASDIIANTADATTASIESLQEGLQNVGPIANQYGLNFADVNAILGVFSDNNLRGAEAGTALKSALTNLSTARAKAELKKLGVSLTDTDGNFRDFNDIIMDISHALNDPKTIRISNLPGVNPQNRAQIEQTQQVLANATRNLFLWQNQLAAGSDDPEKQAQKVAEYQRQIDAANQALVNLTGNQSTANYITREVTRTQQQNAESIKALFGSYGQVAGSILVASGGFGELRDQILGSGTAAERAQRLMDNFAGDIEQLRGSVETLNTKAFLPLISKIFRPFVKLGRLVVDTILRMDDRVLEFISTAIAFGSILATVIGTGAILVGTLISIGGGLFSLILAATNVIAIIGAVVGGLAALVTGFIAVAGIVTVVGGVLAGITAVFEALSTIFNENLGGARTAFENFTNTISEAATPILTIIQTLGELIGNIVGSDSQRGLQSLGKTIADFFDGITTKIRSSGVVDTLQGASELLSGFLDVLTLGSRKKAAAKAATDRLTAIADRFDISADDISRSAQYARDIVQKNFDDMVDALTKNKLLTRIFGRQLSKEEVQRVISQFIYFVGEIKSAFRKVTGAFGSFFDDLKTVGFGKAFDRLKENLNDGLGDLLGTLLEGVQGIFHVDLAKEIDISKSGGLAAGISVVFERLLEAAKNKLIENRQGVTKILKSIFQFFFSPLKSVGFIGKLFGIKPLEDIANEVNRIIGGIFEGIINTVFNLLEGMSLGDALKNAFGPGIEPILNFVQALGDAATSIITILGNIFTAIFGPVQIGGEGSVQFIDVLDSIFTSLTDTITNFNDKVLSKLASGDALGALSGFAELIGSDFLGKIVDDLRAGDFSRVIGDIAAEVGRIVTDAIKLVPSLITDLGTTLNSPLLTSIGENLQTGDWAGVAAAIADGVKTVLTNAIASVPGLITNIGELLNSPMLVSIGNDLAAGDYASAVATIASNLLNLITTAISSIPGLITNLGEILNSPLLTKIGSELSSGDYTDVIDTIATAIKNLIMDAIGKVPELITDIGDSLHLDFLSDLGLTLEQTRLFDWFSSVIGNLASYPLEAINTGLKGIKDAINAFNTNPQTAGAIAAIVGAIILFAERQAIITTAITVLQAVVGGFRTLVTTAWPLILVATAIITIKNVLENLGKFLSGDIGGALGDTLSGIAEDILNLTGLNDIIKQTFNVELSADYIQAQLQLIPEMLELVLNDAAERVSTGFRNIADGLVLEVIRTGARIAVAGGLAQQGFGVDFFKIQDNFQKIQNIITQTGSNLILDQGAQQAFDQIADVLADPANAEFVKIQLRTQFAQIFDAFTKTDFRTALAGSVDQQKQAADVLSILIGADGLVEGAAFLGQQYGPDVLNEMMKNLLEFRPDALDGLDINATLTELFRKAAGGDIGSGIAIDIASSLLLTGKITQEQFDKFKEDITTQMDELAKAAENAKNGTPAGKDPTPVEVTVQPKPVMPTDGKSILTQDLGLLVKDSVTGAADSAATELAPEVPVTPTFTFPTSPAEVQTLSDNLAIARTNLGLLQTDLMNFAANTQTAVDQLNTIGGYLNDINDDAVKVIGTIQQLVEKVLGYVNGVSKPLVENQAAWRLWSISVVNSLQPVVDKMLELNTLTSATLNGLADIASGNLKGHGTGDGGGGGDGKRASGGPVRTGGLYQIIEDGVPEVLYQNGKHYLLSAGSGMVTPIAPLPAIGTADRQLGLGDAAQMYSRQFSPSTNGVSYVNIDEGDINITITAPLNSDPQKLAAIVKSEVRKEIDNRNTNIRSRLRTGHRA